MSEPFQGNPFRDRSKPPKRPNRPKARPCPKCSSRKRQNGYGFAAGPMGAYEFCAAAKCGMLLDFYPDTDGMTEEQEKAALDKAKNYLDGVWNRAPATPVLPPE